MRLISTVLHFLVGCLILAPGGVLQPAGSFASTQPGSTAQAEIPPELSDAVAKSWKGGKSTNLPAAIRDGDETTYVVLTPTKEDPTVTLGLEWEKPARINGLEVHYATLNGTAYEPLPDYQTLEYSSGDQWHSPHATIRVDYSQEKKFAPFQGSGWVSWIYRFEPVEAAGVRLVLGRASSRIPWRQRYAVREIKPFFSKNPANDTARVTLLKSPSMPEMDESLIDWASAEQGATQSRGATGLSVSWPRPTMVDEVVLPLSEMPGPLQWWDGRNWRIVPILNLELSSSKPPRLRAGFLPVAVTRLRLPDLPSSVPVQIHLSRNGASTSRVFKGAVTDVLSLPLSGLVDFEVEFK